MKSKAIIFLLLTFVVISNRSFAQLQVVPPTVLSFSVEGLKMQSRLKWSVTGENNLKEYQVWRSVDEQNWYLVWQMPAKNRSGQLNYEFIDRTVAGGINFYRLESLTTDNKKSVLSYTKVDAEDFSKAIDITTDVKAGKIKLVSAELIQSIELELVDELDRNYPVAFVRDNTHEITIVTGPIVQGAYYLRCYLNKQRYVWKKAVF